MPDTTLVAVVKGIDVQGCRIALAPSVVAVWVKPALRPYTHLALKLLLGKLGSVGRPGNMGGRFLASAKS